MIEKIQQAVSPLINELGYELVEVADKVLYGERHIIIYIDSENGIGLDDCERVSNAVEDIIDSLDPTSGVAYNLDVSSSGLDRRFDERAYKRNIGKEIYVKLIKHVNKQLSYSGVLLSYSGERITLKLKKDKLIELEMDNIQYAHKAIKF